MKSLIKRLLRESLQPKKQYLGQCDLLRFKGTENEDKWQDMMRNRKKIPLKSFLNNVEISQMLDDDEDPIQFLKDASMEDPDLASYVSNWGDKEAMFLQYGGFEFIFM